MVARYIYIYIKHRRNEEVEEETIDIPFFTPPHPSYPSRHSCPRAKSSSFVERTNGCTSRKQGFTSKAKFPPIPFGSLKIHLHRTKVSKLHFACCSQNSRSRYFLLKFDFYFSLPFRVHTNRSIDRSMCLTRVQKISVSRARLYPDYCSQRQIGKRVVNERTVSRPLEISLHEGGPLSCTCER